MSHIFENNESGRISSFIPVSNVLQCNCCRSEQIVRHSRSKIKKFNSLEIFLRSIRRVLRKWIVEKASQDSTSPKFDLEGPRKSFEKCNHSHFYPWHCLHHHAIVPRKLDSTYLQHNPDQRWSSGHRLNSRQWGFQLRRLLVFVAEHHRTNIAQLLKIYFNHLTLSIDVKLLDSQDSRPYKPITGYY